MSFIKDIENSWLWLSIVGSGISSNPSGIGLSQLYYDKNSLREWNRVFLSYNCNRLA